MCDTQLSCQWVICFLLLFRGLLVAGLLGSSIPGKLLLLLSISVKATPDFQLWTLPWVFSSFCCWGFVAPCAIVYLFPPHILIIWTGGSGTCGSSLGVRIKKDWCICLLFSWDLLCQSSSLFLSVFASTYCHHLYHKFSPPFPIAPVIFNAAIICPSLQQHTRLQLVAEPFWVEHTAKDSKQHCLSKEFLLALVRGWGAGVKCATDDWPRVIW